MYKITPPLAQGVPPVSDAKVDTPNNGSTVKQSAQTPTDPALRANRTKTREASMQNSLIKELHAGLTNAVQNNDVKAAQAILRSNLSGLSVEDEEGNTPLLKAIIGKKSEIAEMMLNYAKLEHVNHQNSQTGATPLMWAIVKDMLGIVSRLLEDGKITKKPHGDGES